jgi:hypothetical protein
MAEAYSNFSGSSKSLTLPRAREDTRFHENDLGRPLSLLGDCRFVPCAFIASGDSQEIRTSWRFLTDLEYLVIEEHARTNWIQQFAHLTERRSAVDIPGFSMKVSGRCFHVAIAVSMASALVLLKPGATFTHSPDNLLALAFNARNTD